MFKKNNSQLFFLLSVFLLPLMASYFLYFAHIPIPGKTSQHGVLINPPLHVTEWVPAKKKWQMVYVANTCDSHCNQWLFNLQQIQKALGKDHDRVNVLLGADKNNIVKAQHIYLVDPIGNIFMYYPNTVDPMNILKDVKHVLQVSQIG